MIPKVIHYCWFGKNKLSKSAKKCIKSWKKHLPNYEIIEWNENNFDINCNEYVREAYKSKKYAFVSDYARIYALYNYGGIYMDTDVEVIKSLDKFLCNDAFAGLENEYSIQTAVMGCCKGNLLFKEFLEYYTDKKFIKDDKSLDLTTNVEIITNICKKYGVIINNEIKSIRGFIIYHKDYFCPLNHNNKQSDFSKNTHTIHHFEGSWISREEKKSKKKYIRYLERKEWLCKYISERNAYIILDFKFIIRNKIKSMLKQ